MESPPPEFTFICIDNSKRLFWLNHIFNDQLDAIELYCATLFKLNPDSKVCLYAMSSLQSRILVHSTSDLQEILSCLKGLHCKGDTDCSDALAHACVTFSRSPPELKRRLLMFVGSPIDLESVRSKFYGRELRKWGVAVNVFNFYVLKIDPSFEHLSILSDEYHYGREQLGTLITAVGDDNSQIVDIAYEACICDIVSEFISEKNLHYLEKKGAADNVEASRIQQVITEYSNLLKTRNEKNRAPASRKYRTMFHIPGINEIDRSLLSVRPSLRKTNQQKAEENVSVKEETGLSCNENYKAVAPGKSIEVFDKPKTFCDPMRSIEQCHLEKSSSAAYDESVQAPEIQYTWKVSRRSRSAHRITTNQKKMPISKQELELSCNEKNKSAADDEYGNLSKMITHISGNENQEKAEENASVKQEELKLSCNEKDEAAAQGKCIEVFIKPETLCDLRRSIEQFHKEISTIAADDECFQPPENQYLSKATPPPRRARKKKNQKKMPMFEQESELSCNAKNKSAADEGYGNLLKKTTHISGNEIQENAEENVSVKQEELELSCNEKSEAAAQGKVIKVFIKPETIRDLRRSIEQFDKHLSTSVHATEFKYLSKVT